MEDIAEDRLFIIYYAKMSILQYSNSNLYGRWLVTNNLGWSETVMDGSVIGIYDLQ
jgi:hypothetical protein